MSGGGKAPAPAEDPTQPASGTTGETLSKRQAKIQKRNEKAQAAQSKPGRR